MAKSITRPFSLDWKSKCISHRHAPRSIKWKLRKRQENSSSDATRYCYSAGTTGDDEEESSPGQARSLQRYPTPPCLQILMESLKTSSPVQPDKFLRIIFKCRGIYTNLCIPTHSDKWMPSKKQTQDYDSIILQAVRESNVNALEILAAQGRTMSACNKFGESILHLACKRASFETVRFLLSHGADLSVRDDYGRTPMHDACWRPEPDFALVSLLLTLSPSLLMRCDKWGFTPLMYITQEQWTPWCSFLYYHQALLYPCLVAADQLTAGTGAGMGVVGSTSTSDASAQATSSSSAGVKIAGGGDDSVTVGATTTTSSTSGGSKSGLLHSR